MATPSVQPSLVRFGVTSRSVDNDAGWFVIAGWAIAAAATLGMVAAIWQTHHSRPSMVALLFLGGSWWMLQAALNRLSLPQLIGSFVALLGLAIGAESLRDGWQASLEFTDWVSQSRVTWLTIVGSIQG